MNRRVRHIAAFAGVTLIAGLATQSSLSAQGALPNLPPGEYVETSRLLNFVGTDAYANLKAEPQIRRVCMTEKFVDFVRKRSGAGDCRTISGPATKDGMGYLRLSCKRANRELAVDDNLDIFWTGNSYRILSNYSSAGEATGLSRGLTEGVFVYSTKNSRRCNGRND